MSLTDGGYLDFQEHTHSSSIDYDDTICETTTNQRANFSISASNVDNTYEDPLGKKITILHLIFFYDNQGRNQTFINNWGYRVKGLILFFFWYAIRTKNSSTLIPQLYLKTISGF